MAKHRGSKKHKKASKKKNHRKSTSAKKRGQKAWRTFCRKHGGVKKAKAALKRRFSKGKRKKSRK